MEINAKKIYIQNPMATISSADYNRSIKSGECELFNYLSSTVTNDARCTYENTPALPWQKQQSTGIRLFTSKFYLSLRKKSVNCYISSIALLC
jgi:hypothetical protein